MMPDMPLNRSETVFDSPAGPTRRVEFKSAAGGELVRIEFQHLTSGRLVLGHTVLHVDGAGQWFLVDRKDDRVINKFKPPSPTPYDTCKFLPTAQNKTFQTTEFSFNGLPWQALITQIYVQPKAQTGISNESEPAVDLVICRISRT